MKRITSIVLIIATMFMISACNNQGVFYPENSTPSTKPPETTERREAQYTGTFKISQGKVEFAPDATIRELFCLDGTDATYPTDATAGTIEITVWSDARHTSSQLNVTSLDDKVPSVVWFNNKQGDFDAMVLQLKRSTTAITMEVKLHWGNTIDTIHLSFDSFNNNNCKYDGDWIITDYRMTTV